MFARTKSRALREYREAAVAIAIFVFLQGMMFFFDTDLVAKYSSPTYATWDIRWVVGVMIGFLVLATFFTNELQRRDKHGEHARCETCGNETWRQRRF
ncbi:MAG: hypothetical protein CL456_07210 [Acidimicrobiaceae bacterium]|nr:hypothetical protein [Acidimicrobiaceae bacterium]